MRLRVLPLLASTALAAAASVAAAPAAPAAEPLGVSSTCFGQGGGVHCDPPTIVGAQGAVTCTWTPTPYYFYGANCGKVSMRCPGGTNSSGMTVSLRVTDATGRTGYWSTFSECMDGSEWG